jgi:hypothetical protein
VLFAVLIVAAAGLIGTAHFTGPRWVPNWHFRITRATHSSSTLRAAPATSFPKISRSHGADSFPLSIVLWVLVAIAAAGVAVLLWRWWSGRRSRTRAGWHQVVARATAQTVIEPKPEPEPDTPALRSGIELALQLLDAQREPGDAIVRAWLGLQETAEESGIVRRLAETPTEFTTRILSRAFDDDRAIRTLLRLYLRTRFGDHPVTIDDVSAVRAALQELVRTWPAPESVSGPRRR